MKWFISLLSIIIFSISSLAVQAGSPHKDKKDSKQKVEKHQHKKLPPGLQKKLDRGGALPPGWQKKLARGEILDQRVYSHAIRVTSHSHSHIEGTIIIRIDDRLIRLYEATREIVDILK